MTIPGINSLNDIDDPRSFKVLNAYVKGLLDKNRYRLEKPLSSNQFSPRAYISWIENYSRELGRAGKGASFILSQTALSLLNPAFGFGKIFNPASVGGYPPTVGSFTTIHGDVPSANQSSKQRLRNQDKLKRLYEGNYSRVENKTEALEAASGPRKRTIDNKSFQDLQKENNIVTPAGSGEDSPYRESLAIDFVQSSNLSNLKQKSQAGGVVTLVPDYTALFTKRDVGPALFEGGTGGTFFKPNPNTRISPSEEYNRKKSALTFDNVFFSTQDWLNGYIEDNDSFIDDDFYVPFSFQDLRKQERKVYFRAFLESFQESFEPKWEMQDYYGRTDPVMTYKSTGRSFDISFKIAAMTPEGLGSMWLKINNVMKMFYPTKANGLLVAAPFVRVRVGDVMATSLGLGLPGIIENPNFDYNESPWETAQFESDTPGGLGKAPQICKMSFKFRVIHDIDPYIDEDYNMNIGNLRRIGDPNEAAERTEDQESDQTRADSRGAVSQNNGGQ